MKIIHLPETPGAGRLGRHVEHDPRSRGFAAAPHPSPHITTRIWRCHAPPFQQGALGACTGNACGGVLMCEPFFTPARILTEADCVRLYALATRLDKIRGHYPPEDTGSSGIAVAKAALRSGYIKSYRHAFGLQHVLGSLMRAPGMAGIPWYAGFDRPQGVAAVCELAGEVRGGHEIAIVGVDLEAGLVRFRQSWGPDWGDHGYGSFTLATFDRLLSEDGDYVELSEAA